ncbi:prolyl oligopeptidase family serine peptidase [Chitinispirillales bacterium ANBcel5]|uniref:alpha/beta hydrolase family protein n=1 Tax=Cellulosispirillum alkaliphilum TaxID=3039283 RepID=UPI002A516083|nr:prolyl oligopeptidase family serine peptidase [Chitinispirillales bacterium ANBcel5]
MKLFLVKMSVLACIVALPLVFTGCSRTITLDFRRYVVEGETGDVTYYVGYNDETNYERVLLFIRGSGMFPASKDFGMGAEASLFGYQIVYPQKSDVFDEQEYFITNNRYQRLHDLNTVIDDLLERGIKEILIMADSEGTMLAPQIAAERGALITGYVAMAGSVSTFEEDLLFSVEHAIGRSQQWGIESAEELRSRIETIYADPDNVTKEFLGHSYRFWSSYLRYNPAQDLKKVKSPILYINGELDELDLATQLEIIEDLQSSGVQIDNIVYSGVGHKVGLEKGRQMYKDIFAWAKEHGLIE